MKRTLTAVIVLALLAGSLPAQAAGPRRTVAVLDFQLSDALDRALASTLADYTRQSASRAGTYDLVDRANIDAIMQEQVLQSSDVVSEEKAVEIGKLAGAQLIAKGSVTVTGGAYAISLQLIDVETAKIVKVATGTYRGNTEGLLASVQKVASSLFAVRAPVQPWQAAIRSALAPGVGQLTSGRPVMGWLLAGTSVALLGAGGTLGYLLYDAHKTYLTTTGYLVDYDSLWSTVTARRDALIGISAAFGVVYAYGIVDALFFTPRPKEEKR
jgi:hypothetical protein